jgi:type I restriction enzyme, S subunit
MSWQAIRFGDAYAEASRNGVYKPKEFHGAGAKIVNMGELFRYDFIAGQEMARLQMSDSELSKSGLCDGDLLFGRRSLVDEGAGKCSLVANVTEPTTFESSLIRVRVRQDIFDPRFLFYWFKSPIGRGRIRAIVSGVNVKGIRGSDLQNIEVVRPDLPTQQRIAGVLSAYDDLIQNNRRRIGLLEQAARLLYREWFVHLRFPGHETAKIVDGLPEGWSSQLLADLCVEGDGIQTGPFGSQLHQSDYTDTGVPVVMPKDMKDNKVDCDRITRIPESLAGKLGRHRMLPGDTVYGRRGDIGRRAFIGKRQTGFFCGTGCLRIRPDPEKINARYLFETLGSPATSGFIANQAKGSTMPNLSTGALKKVPVLCAPDALQVQFTKMIEQMFETAEILDEQITRLTRARDLLLPRLMDGRIPV